MSDMGLAYTLGLQLTGLDFAAVNFFYIIPYQNILWHVIVY